MEEEIKWRGREGGHEGREGKKRLNGGGEKEDMKEGRGRRDKMEGERRRT